MTRKNTGGPAFSRAAFYSDGGARNYDSYPEDGMSLRDYFAGQAISSIPNRSWDHLEGDDMDRIKAWARCAYLVADAMIEERSK